MKYKLLIILGTIIVVAGCTKKLDIANPNAPTSEDVWQTPGYAQLGVNSMYSTYHRVGLCRMQFFMNMIRSDEGFSTSPNGDLINNFDQFVVTDYNMFERRSFYEDCYVGIARANQVLENVPKIVGLDDASKSQFVGEAKFMRGLFYYYLAEYFGNVPLQLKISLTTDLPPTSPRAEVFAQIEKDLSEAAIALPVSYDANNLGRATRGAAYALLGKAYLQDGNQYQKAGDALQWLTEGDGKGVYKLTSNYRDNFVITTENNSESVFEFQYALNPSDSHDDDVNPGSDNLNYGTSIPPFFAPRPIGFTDGQARRWVIDTMEMEKTAAGQRDPRIAATFLFDSTDVRGPDFTMVYGQTWASRDYSDDPGNPIGVATNHTVYFRKFLNDFTDNGESFHSGNNYRFIRYADVLLLYAEALNGLGKTQQAYQYVDRVRERAGLKALSVIKPNLSQQDFLMQLKHERICELSGEGHRWEDLDRWGDLGPQLASRDAGFANFVVGKNELLPIPQQDIDYNPNLKQNPGW